MKRQLCPCRISQASVVKVHHSQEPTQFRNCYWFGKLRHGLHFFRYKARALLTDHNTQKFYFRLGEYAFAYVEVQ